MATLLETDDVPLGAPYTEATGIVAIYTGGRFLWPAVRKANPGFVFDQVSIDVLKSKGSHSVASPKQNKRHQGRRQTALMAKSQSHRKQLCDDLLLFRTPSRRTATPKISVIAPRELAPTDTQTSDQEDEESRLRENKTMNDPGDETPLELWSGDGVKSGKGDFLIWIDPEVLDRAEADDCGD